MIGDIIDGIVNKLIAAGLEVKEFNYKDLVTKETQTLCRPSVSVVCGEALVSKLTLTSYKYSTIISLVVTVSRLPTAVPSGEKRKKVQIYDLLEAIADTVQLQDFGLALENPMIPMGFRNITPYELYKVGYQVYQIRFRCSFNVKYEDKDRDQDQGKLLSIMNQYWLMPNDSVSTDTSRAGNLITLT